MRNSKVDKLDGFSFEYYCAGILKKNGFHRVRVTQSSGDYGVDILAVKKGRKYAIQCKRYSGSVGNHAVQEVYSGKDFYNCDVAVVMTNSYFTQAAVETANKLNVKLWDGYVLKSMKRGFLPVFLAERKAKRCRSKEKRRRKRKSKWTFGKTLLLETTVILELAAICFSHICF